MRRQRIMTIVAAGILGIVAGCDDDSAPKKKVTVKARETINKTTQNVLKLEEALKDGGVPALMKIKEGSDYLEANAAAYRTSVGKIAQMKVDMDMRQYEALNGAYPKDYDEFMAQIIKKGQPDGIQLPMLPYYQEYAYDAPNHQLVVVEFPAKKEQFAKERDARLGRE